MFIHQQSDNLYERACVFMPGGVNSPVRAFKGVDGTPLFFRRGSGARLEDVDGNSYIDYVCSWGALILGHAHPDVVSAVAETAADGTSFGAPCAAEIRLAEKIIQLVPAIEQVRMVNSGTEATMTALRLARGVTGKNKIIKFDGCYHGHSDALLARAGSGVLTLGIPQCRGVPDATAGDTLIAPYNDAESVKLLFDTFAEDIAAIIVEPIAGNMGMVMPQAGFLQSLRTLCDDYNVLLIFDEVITGFRIAKGGASEYFGIKPDLITLGKIPGGGLPFGALGGSREIMANLAPLGDIYQAGTLSGNPLVMAAGYTTLQILDTAEFYPSLTELTQLLTSGLQELANYFNIPLYTTTAGGMFGFKFIGNNAQQQYIAFHRGMLERGVYLAPSMFEAAFVSAAHTREDIELTLEAVRSTFATMTTGDMDVTGEKISC